MSKKRNPLSNKLKKSNINPLTGKPISQEALGVGRLSGGTTYVPKFNEQIRLLYNPGTLTDIDKKLATEQTTGEQIGRTLEGFGLQLAGGFLQAIGSQDPSIGLNTIAGVEDQYDNWFMNTGQDLVQRSEGERFQIHEKDPGGVHFGDTGWWLNLIKRTGLSVGIAAEAAVETLIISALTGGTGAPAQLMNKAKGIHNIMRVLRGVNKTQKVRRSAMMWAGIRRHSESIIEASEAARETKEILRRERPDLTEDEINAFAADRAARTYRGNLPLMVFDMITAGRLTVNPVKGTTKGFIDKGLKKIGNKWVRTGVSGAILGTSEGMEEFFQHIVSEETKYRTLLKTGLVDRKLGRDRGLEYLKSNDSWNAFFSGVIGAGILSGGATAYRKVKSKFSSGNPFEKAHRDFLNNMLLTGRDIQEGIKQEEEAGNLDKANNLRRLLGIDKAFNSVHLDMMNDSDKAFKGYKEYLSDVIEAIDTEDTEQLKELNIDDAVTNREMFQQYLEDADKIKNIYDEVSQYNPPETFLPLVHAKFTIDLLNNEEVAINKELAEYKSKYSEYSKLSSVGREIMDTRISRDMSKLEVKRLKNQIKQSKDPARREQLRRRIVELEKGVDFMNKILEDIKREDTRKDSEKQEDSSIINSIDTNTIASLELKKHEVRSELEGAREDQKKWGNKKWQQKASNEKLSSVIRKAKSIPELNDIEARLKQQGRITVKLEKQINNKKKKLQVTPVETPTNDDYTEDEFETDPDFESNEERGQAYDDLDYHIEDSDNFLDEFDDKYSKLFTLQTIDDHLSDPQKQRVKDLVQTLFESLKSELGRNPSFREVIQDGIDHKSKEFVKSRYNAIVLGWKLNNYPLEDFQKLYNQLFANRIEIWDDEDLTLLEKEKQNIIPDPKEDTPQAKKEEAEKVQTEAKEEEASYVREDSLGQPIKYTNSIRTVEVVYKAGFLSVPYSVSRRRDEAGNLTVDKQTVGIELYKPKDLKSYKLLIPDRYNEGEKLTIRIPENFEEIEVTVWEKDSKEKSIPFKQWVKANGGENMPIEKYVSKIPMFAYDRDGDPVFSIHDTDWFNTFNIGLEEDPKAQAEVIKENRKLHYTLRENLYFQDSSEENNPLNNRIGIEITNKRMGTFHKIPSTHPLMVLNEANPQAKIAIGDKGGNSVSYYEDGKIQTLNINEDNVHRQSKVNEGVPYDVRVAFEKKDKEGNPVKSYFVNPLSDFTLTDKEKKTLVNLTRAYMAKKSNDPTVRKNAEKVREGYKNITGQDLFNPQVFEEVLRQYVRLNNVIIDSNENSYDVIDKIHKNPKIKTGETFLVFGYGGNLVMGIKTQKKEEQRKEFKFISPATFASNNRQKSGETITYFEDRILTKRKQNASIQALKQDDIMVTVNDNFNVIPYVSTTNENNYESYLKDQYKSDIVSHNVGTEENPVYASVIQPVIHYKALGQVEVQVETVPSVSSYYTGTDPIENTQFELKLTTHNDGSKTLYSKNEEGVYTKISDYPKETKDNRILGAFYNLQKVEDVATETEVETEQTEEDLTELLRISKTQLSSMGSKNIDKLFPPKTDSLLTPQMLSDVQKREAKEGLTVNIDGLTVSQETNLVNFLVNKILKKINDEDGRVSKAKIEEELSNAYDIYIEPNKQEKVDVKNNLQKLVIKHPQLNPLIEEYDEVLDVYDRIKDNWEKIQAITINSLSKLSGLKITKDILDDELVTESFDHSKESFEIDHKSSTSSRLKIFFSHIYDVTPNNDPRKGFLELPLFMNFDTVYDTVEQIIASKEPESDYNAMVNKLKDSIETYPWLKQFIDRLEEGNNEQNRLEFTYEFTRHALSMKFVMYSYNKKNDTYTLKVYNTNQNNLINTIRKSWEMNLENSNLVSYISEEDSYTINKTKAKELLKIYENWTEGSDKRAVGLNINSLTDEFQYTLATVGVNNFPTITLDTPIIKNKIKGDEVIVTVGPKEYLFTKTGENKYKVQPYVKIKADADAVQNWLERFGITLSEGAVKELQTYGLTINDNSIKGYTKISFNDLFTEPKDDKGHYIFGLMGKYLKGIIQEERPSFNIDNEKNHPYNNIGPLLNLLAKIEAKHDKYSVVKSFRDNKKLIYGFTNPKFITDRTRKLKEDKDLRDDLFDISFSKHSLWLDLLQNSSQFRNKFQIDHLGLTAIKALATKVYKDNKITKLSNYDHELMKLGMFMDMNQGELKEKKYGLRMRIARMLYPLAPDKTGSTIASAGVIDFAESDLFDSKSNSIKFSDNTNNLLFGQLVLPELERIVNYYKTFSQNPSGIKDYDLAASIFNFIPELNNIKDENDITALENIATDPVKYNVDWFTKKYKIKSIQIIREILRKQVSDKYDLWDEAYVKGDKIAFLDNSYFKKNYKFKGDTEKVLKLTAYDFVINSMISNSNMYMTVIGDPALYSKDKNFKDSENPLFEELDGKLLTYRPLRDDSYFETAFGLDTNMSKRFALLIAPGKILANSKGRTYTQILMNDQIDISENIFNLIDIFYEGKDVEKAKKLINIVKTDKNEGKREKARRALKDMYPDIGDYFDIESTDAQEYITLSEHLYILYHQGRLTTEKYNDLNKKVNESVLLTKEEIGTVLQPIKPVYTGQVIDKQKDVSRVVYIKSSSFPLIPQLTVNTQLDKLRKAMEKYQVDHNTNVRASYQTANKIGSVTNKDALNVFDEQGNVKELDNNDLERASLVLNREDLKIQQEVPYKEDKEVISMGTQSLKILFSNGVLDMKGFKYNGDTYTGKALYDNFTNNFSKLVNYKKQMLYDELGVDLNTNLPKNPKTAAKQLRSLLLKEANKRDYPRQDIEALDVIHVTDNTGKIVGIEFKQPIWLASNSNKYENLLLAIVKNRIISLKFPGSSFVTGSESGFKYQEGLEGVTTNKIIYTNKWNGKELKASYKNKKNGGFTAQIFMPSRFRDNEGNLINLFDKNEDGYIYIDRVNGKWMLKEDMIEEQLMKQFSFRIPTSSHVSLSQVEIVGFLPEEMGDLVILPKNFTKQMGLDFDIDKQYSYNLWTHTDENGKITELGGDISLSDIDAEIEKTRYDLEGSLKGSVSLDRLKFTLDQLSEDISNEQKDKIISDLGVENPKIVRELRNKLTNLIKNKQKLYENEIVKIHNSVVGHPDMENKISRVLSTAFAQTQAEEIDKKLIKSKDFKNFTFLSDEHQKNKIISGASGSIAIGVYSQLVTTHAIIEQANKINIDPIRLTVFDEETDKIENFTDFSIGDVPASNGILGGTKTLDGERLITEVIAEKQNTALDHASLQILGRVNINEITINVDTILTLLGFDKTKNAVILDNGEKLKMSVPYLFLSQPIIRDYAALKKNEKSNIKEFDLNIEQKIINQLRKKYESEYEFYNAEHKRMANKDMDGQGLYNNLTDPDNFTQNAVLEKYLELQKFGEKLITIQSLINIGKTGAGKSLFETIDKYEGISNLRNNQSFANIFNLVGVSTEIEVPDQHDGLIEQGYIKMNNGLYVKPTTPVGDMLVQGVVSAYDLWLRYFPYKDEFVDRTLNSIIDNMSKENMTSQKRVELKEAIFKDMKKYFNSSDKLGFFDPEKSIVFERKRLFMDIDGNESLAHYLKRIKQIKNNPVIDKNIKNNKLINKFSFDLKKDGTPSIIKSDNASASKFDENYLYTSILELIDNNERLPDFNDSSYMYDLDLKFDEETTKEIYNDQKKSLSLKNELVPDMEYNEIYKFKIKDKSFKLVYKGYLNAMEIDALTTISTKYINVNDSKERRHIYEIEPFYTTSDLGQDLAAYAYFEGGVQEAIQFSKYVPISYLNAIGFNATTREWNSNKEGNKYIFGSMLKPTRNELGKFERQLFQHQPHRVFQLQGDLLDRVLKANKKTSVKDLDVFVYSLEKRTEVPMQIVSVYDNTIKKGRPYRLYEYVNGVYRRIPTLGAFGMVEYDLSERYVNESLIKGNNTKVTNVFKTSIATTKINMKNESLQLFDLESNDINKVMQNIINDDLDITSEYASVMQEIPVSATIEIGSTVGRGEYRPSENKIIISEDRVNDLTKKQLAETIIKEYAHAITYKELDKYFKIDPITKTSELREEFTISSLPQHIKGLHILYNEVMRKLSDNEDFKKMQEKFEFMKKTQQKQYFSEAEKAMYGALNIHEFTSEIFENEGFQKELAKIKYKSSELTLLERFFKLFGKLINNVRQSLGLEQYNEDALSQGLAHVFAIFEEVKKAEEEKQISIEASIADMEAEKALDEYSDNYQLVDSDNFLNEEYQDDPNNYSEFDYDVDVDIKDAFDKEQKKLNTILNYSDIKKCN